MAFDAFVSYSHDADDKLAPALSRGVQRLARPWYRTRALRVFCDESVLSANPHLWSSIQAALDESDWFVLLASPDAACSEWVNRELDHWLANKSADRILVALTDGSWEWDPNARRSTGTAVPPPLVVAFGDEPRHVDIRWARTETDLDLRNTRFRDAIAQLAAPIHGIDKDQLESEDVQLHRRARRLAQGATSLLVVLLILAVTLGAVAVQQRNGAQHQADIARREADAARLEANRLLGEKLAAQSINALRDGQSDLAQLLAVEANHLESSAYTKSALLGALAADWTLVRQLRGLSSDTTAASFSLDGRVLAVLDQTGNVALWNVGSGSRLASLQGLDPSVPIVALQVSADGKHLFAVRSMNTPSNVFGQPAAAARNAGSIGVWDVATGRLLRILDGGSDVFQAVTGAAPSLIGAIHPTHVRLWNPDTAKLVRDVYVGPVDAAAVSPDGSLLAAAHVDATPSDYVESVRVWSVATGQPVGAQCHSDVGLGFDSPGMAYVGAPHVVDLAFDAGTTTVRSELSGGRYAVTASCVIASGATRTTRVDVHTSTDAPVVGISPDGRTLAARNLGDGSITVFDGATGQAIGPARPSTRAGDPSYDEVPVVFSPDGTLIVGVHDANGEVKLWRSRPTAPLLATEERVPDAISLSPSGHLIGTADGEIIDTRTGRVLVETHSPDVAFSVEDRYVAALETRAGYLTSVSIWHLPTGPHPTSPPTPIRHDLPQICGFLGGLAFSPNARLLATSCSDSRVALIDVASARVLSINRTGVSPNFAAFTADGRILAVADEAHCCGGVQLFDVSDDQLHPGAITETLFAGPLAASRRLIATATSKGILLWSADAQHPQQTVLNERGRTADGPVAFSADGSVLAAADASGNLQLWDLDTDSLIGTMPGEAGWTAGLSIAPNGQTVTSLHVPNPSAVSASTAFIVHWDLDVTAWENRACDLANRNLTRSEWSKYLSSVSYSKVCPSLP